MDRWRKQTLIVAGVVALAVVSALVIVFVMVSIVLVRGHDAAMRAGNEAATIQNMKTIAAVEAQFFNAHNRTFATIDQLARERMLSTKFKGEPVSADGYRLALKLNASATNYSLTADPVDDAHGRNHFYLEGSSTQIHQNAHGPAGPNDPANR